MTLFRSRKYWRARAEKLEGQEWTVGRTDIQSIGVFDGRLEHYAYRMASNQTAVTIKTRFTGLKALKKAVLFAEKMNRIMENHS